LAALLLKKNTSRNYHGIAHLRYRISFFFENKNVTVASVSEGSMNRRLRANKQQWNKDHGLCYNRVGWETSDTIKRATHFSDASRLESLTEVERELDSIKYDVYLVQKSLGRLLVILEREIRMRDRARGV
jgi:hypothetical protein